MKLRAYALALVAAALVSFVADRALPATPPDTLGNPVQAWGAQQCDKYIVWILFDSGKFIRVMEDSGIKPNELNTFLKPAHVEIRVYPCGIAV